MLFRSKSVIDSILAGLISLIVFGPIVGVVLDGYSFNLQPAHCQILYEGPHPKRPLWRLITARHAVVQGTQGRRRNTHHIIGLVGKPLARLDAVVGGSEQGAQKQYKTIRVLVIFIECLLRQLVLIRL